MPTAMLDVLIRDGRASYSTLARAAGVSVGKVRRRIETLTAAGVIYFDVDLAPAATGAYAPVTLWLTATPGTSQRWAKLASHDAVPSAAAVSGPANPTATVTATDLADAYTFITGTLAELSGITGYELAPRLRHLKQSGALITDGRLTTPTRRPRSRRNATSTTRAQCL